MTTFRITFFDLNHIRPNHEVFVEADAKYLAIEAARLELHNTARQHIEMLTNGMHGNSYDLTNHKGELSPCRVVPISPEFYDHMIDECWGIAEVMRVSHVGKTISSESTVAKAEAKLRANHAECEYEQQADTSTTRRKKRWTRAQKRAAAAAKAKASELTLVA